MRTSRETVQFCGTKNTRPSNDIPILRDSTLTLVDSASEYRWRDTWIISPVLHSFWILHFTTLIRWAGSRLLFRSHSMVRSDKLRQDFDCVYCPPSSWAYYWHRHQPPDIHNIMTLSCSPSRLPTERVCRPSYAKPSVRAIRQGNSHELLMVCSVLRRFM